MKGVLALWKGVGPTVVRAMALNMGMLASYDRSVEFFRDYLGWDETRAVVGKMIDQELALFQDSLLRCVDCHLFIQKLRFKRCSLMWKLTWIFLNRIEKLEEAVEL
ncbi:hypothetical protein Vadar_028484 [Vaccinium darrowii]|uniref:Uncharacterized protein n=1 Tax=Vaccinium darrowii TaxID=229202 RepID=A0ACB7YQ43_9ERIC|nr:hypothetical protein Vadar_028484 [Vaccinium darrowii]